ncbi:hypothetical protein C1645_811021 [Glomus cerebriforme]|uniref:Uncharacterized protein n=1 Tax=Glomus cerebriforme TaxID=658196 RepID=A0A397TTH5_9GLOM|nr:hypothetical protein C1645_811021 [Glomus cerebriforme]
MSDIDSTIIHSSFSTASANEHKKHRYNLEGVSASALSLDNADNTDHDSKQIRNQACGREQRYNCGCGHGHDHDHDHTLRNSNIEINEDTNQIEYIPPVDTKDLLKKVHITDCMEQKSKAKALLKDLYAQLKQDLAFSEEIRMPNIVEKDDIFANMWSNDQQITQMDESDEIKCYLQVPDESKTLDLLL